MEAEESNASLQQIGLLASLAGPENLQALVEDGARLQESILRAKDLIMEKKEWAINPSRPHIEPKTTQDHPPKDIQSPQTEEQSQRNQMQDVLSFTELKQDVGTWAGDLQVYVDKNGQALEKSGAVKVIFLSWFCLLLT